MSASWSEAAVGASRTVEEGIDRVAGSRWASAAAIVIVALFCFLPGFASIPAIDRDETGFAEAARQMAAGGDFSSADMPDRGGVVPPGVAWLQAAVVSVAGGDGPEPIWIYRVPSLLGAVAVALLTWWMALAFGRPRAALLAGLLMAANTVLGGEARLARPDAVLLAVIVLSQGALVRLWLGQKWGREVLLPLLFWLSLGAGILIKGVIAPVALGATVLALVATERDYRWLGRLHPAWGVPVTLVVLLPWLAALVAGPSLPADSAAVELLQRLGGNIDPRGPPGSYALAFFAIFWPGASLFVLAVPWAFGEMRRPAILFAAASSVPFWLLAELWPQKLPHFILPAFPGIALIAAMAADVGAAKVTGRFTRFFALGPLLWPMIVAIGLPIVLIAAGIAFPLAALVPLVVSIALGGVAWVWLNRNRPVAATGLSVVVAMAVYLGLHGMILPTLDAIAPGNRMATLAKDTLTCADPQYAAAGFVEPSLPLITGAGVRYLEGADAASFLAEGGCHAAVVETRHLSSFLHRGEDLGVEFHDRGGVSGFNLGSGRWVMLRLFTLGGAGQ